MWWLLVGHCRSQADADKVKLPGFGDDYAPQAWSGYLDTGSNLKKLFYVFT
jgi:serine carboxypeptidase-like clade 1